MTPPIALTFRRPLAILSGLGPHAGAYALTDLLRLAREKYGAYEDHEYPEVVLHSLPYTGSDATGVADAEQVRIQMSRTLRRLADLGIELALIACNSSHAFIEQLRHASTVQIVSLIDAAAREIGRSSAANFTVLGSQSTRASGIYANAITAAGKRHLAISDEEQQQVNEIIALAMTGEANGTMEARFCSLLTALRDRGAGQIVLGCTELSWLARLTYLPVDVIDSLECATRELLAAARGAAPAINPE